MYFFITNYKSMGALQSHFCNDRYYNLLKDAMDEFRLQLVLKQNRIDVLESVNADLQTALTHTQNELRQIKAKKK